MQPLSFGYLLLREGEPPRLLTPGRFLIGRAPQCDIQCQLPGISRIHASIEVLPRRGVVICDENSTNGTFVDGERIQRVALDRSASLRIGELNFALRPVSEDRASDPAPGTGLPREAHGGLHHTPDST